MKLRGAFTALVTPFSDGKVDEDALRALVRRQIDGGIDGLVPCGTTGESVTLKPSEHARVVAIVAEEAAGKVPVFAGAGTNDTAKSIELAKACAEAGADGLLLVGPYYNKPTQRGIEAHFRAILDAVALPAMLYNIPGRTSKDIELSTLLSLCADPRVVAIKEATGNVLRGQAIAAALGDDCAVFSGDDALTLPLLAVGGVGVVSVTSNVFPGEVAEVCRLGNAGDFAGARKAHQRLLGVHDAMFIESNPGPVKGAMAKRGWLKPELRMPMVMPTEETQAALEAAIAEAGL